MFSTVTQPIEPEQKIVIIAPYFGRFPSFLPLTLRSMAENPSIRWHVPTDTPFKAPPNVDVVRTSFDDFRRRCQEHFDFELSMDAPYKICDLRPAFGEIFSSEIGTSDFWGHSDWDIIFGNIRETIDDKVLNSFDKIFVRGSLSFYRNSQIMNTLYRDITSEVDYRQALSSDRSAHFDEWSGIWKLLSTSGIPVWNDEALFDINPQKFSLRANASTTAKPCYRWSNGRVFEYDRVSGTETEGVAIHLQKRSMRSPTSEVLSSPEYWITGSGFQVRAPERDSVVDAANFYYRRLRRYIRKRFN